MQTKTTIIATAEITITNPNDVPTWIKEIIVSSASDSCRRSISWQQIVKGLTYHDWLEEVTKVLKHYGFSVKKQFAVYGKGSAHDEEKQWLIDVLNGKSV